MENEEKRCGYVALLGRPNVGKSTLMNHVLRQKLAATSRKPQTTRHNLLGIDSAGASQALYIDTPGLHAPGGRALNQYMVGEAKAVIADVDVRVMLVEALKWTAEDEHVLNLLRGVRGTTLAVVSKVDLVKDKTKLLPFIQKLHDMDVFTDIVPLSALKNDGIEHFRELISSLLPAGEHLYGEDEITDKPLRFLVAEIVREKLMRQLGEELPHATAVVVERYVETDSLVEIHADIYVERNGQKRIVIGSDGERIKLLGQAARKDIETLVDKRVMLNLWVKVKKGWSNNAGLLKRLGYD